MKKDAKTMKEGAHVTVHVERMAAAVVHQMLQTPQRKAM